MAKNLMLAYTIGPKSQYLSDIGSTMLSSEEMVYLPTTHAHNSKTTEVVTVYKDGLDLGTSYSCCRRTTGIRFVLSIDTGIPHGKGMV